MDAGHISLAAAVVLLVAAWVLRRRHRELHIRIDWKESHDDDSDR